MIQPTEIKLNRENFKNVYRNQSMDPEGRANRSCNEFENKWLNFQNGIIEELTGKKIALNPEQIRAIEELFKEKAPLYQRYVEDYLYKQSDCASTMIVGRGNFDCARHEKNINSSMNKYNKITDGLETWERMAHRKVKSLITKDQQQEQFFNEVKGQYFGRDEHYLRALLKSKLERRAKHENIDYMLNYIEDNIEQFKITQKSIDKIRLIKPLAQRDNIGVLEISKQEYFANRALVKSLGFRWNKVEKQWIGRKEMIAKYNEMKGA